MMPKSEAIHRLVGGRDQHYAFRAEFPDLYPQELTKMDAANASMYSREAIGLAVTALMSDHDVSGYFAWTRVCGEACVVAARNCDPLKHQEYWGPIFLRRIVVVLAGGHFDLAATTAKEVLDRQCECDTTKGLKYQQLLAPAWSNLAGQRWEKLGGSASAALAYLQNEESWRTGAARAMIGLVSADVDEFRSAILSVLRDHRKLCGEQRDYANSPADHLICWEAVALLQCAIRRNMRTYIDDELIPSSVILQ